MTRANFIIYRKLSRLCGAFAFVTGLFVIFGWLADQPMLTSLVPSCVSMKVNTALGFLLAGAGICFLYERETSLNENWRLAVNLCAISLLIMGGLTVVEYTFGLNLGIDELFWKQPIGFLDKSAPGRMSPITAAMQVNFGLALWLMNTRDKKNVFVAQCFSFFGCTVGTLTLIGYLLESKELYATGHYTAVAFTTAVCFIAISVGLLFVAPRSGAMHTFTSDTRTGAVLRQLVPFALFAPVLIGWLRLKGQKHGLYSTETGIAIMVTSAIIACQFCIYWITRKFEELEKVLRRREEISQEQAELLNLTHDSIIVRKLDGTILFWNTGAEKMYGFLKSDAVGKIIHEILQTRFPQELDAINSQVLERGRWDGELVHSTKDGRTMVVASRWSSKLDGTGKPIAIMEINNDISAAKEAEARVSEFYSTVSHELRTPLTSIYGVFRLIDGGIVGEIPPQVKNLVSVGQKETDRLIRLINDILDIKKIEAGKFELNFEDIEPKHLVEQTIQAVNAFAEKFKVTLEANIEENSSIKGDIDRLTQVLTNLISNAIKYSDDGQKVTIQTTKHDHKVRFSIIDRGPGIDPRNVPKLFRMFQQVGSDTGKAKEGTGLGLAICKSLIEQHNGEIGLDSALGEGSTFWFEIPSSQIDVLSPKQIGSLSNAKFATEEEVIPYI